MSARFSNHVGSNLDMERRDSEFRQKIEELRREKKWLVGHVIKDEDQLRSKIKTNIIQAK